MRYFRILADDENVSDKWFLDEPLAVDGQQLDAREFTYGRPYHGALPYAVPIDTEGREVGFNLAAFDMPIVSHQVGVVFNKFAKEDIELFPVKIADSSGGYQIFNATRRESCVDEERSRFIRWKPEDGRPDRTGGYRAIYDLIVDPLATNGRHVFRVEGFEIVLVISETLVEALKDIHDLGVVFKPLVVDVK